MNIIKYLIDILTILCIAALFFAVWLNSSWFFYAKDHLRFNEYNDYKIYKATKGISVVYIAKIRYFKLFWRFKLYKWYTSTGENIRRKCIESSYGEPNLFNQPILGLQIGFWSIEIWLSKIK